MSAFYNDIDEFCCGVLRRRIADGRLPEGIVDERPIQSISARELAAYGQIHLFAGIGGFPFAARLAGLPDDFSILTGGFPCQPWSGAGKRQGTADERHLWPEMLRIIDGVRPLWVLGENVPELDGKLELALDGVCADLEAADYEIGAPFEIPACAVNAPIRRKRLWIVARAKGEPLGRSGQPRQPQHVGRPDFQGLEVGARIGGDAATEFTPAERASNDAGDMGGANHHGRHGASVSSQPREADSMPSRPSQGVWNPWGTAGWRFCGDGKWRRVPEPESGIQLVVAGIPNRVARLRAVGNAICPQVAAEIMRAILDTEYGTCR